MCDTGLMCSMLDWSEKEVYKDNDKSNKLTKTFIYNQILPQVELKRNYTLSHYRDNQKHEIDFIIKSNSKIFNIEVKSSTDIKLDTFKHLEWFKNNMTKGKTFTGIVLHTGERTIQ